MIRRWLATHATRADHRNQLRALSISDAEIKAFTKAGLRPLGADFPSVLMAAQLGICIDEAPTFIHATRRVMDDAPRIDEISAFCLVGRLHAWGIPYDHAATLVTDIAHATEGA